MKKPTVRDTIREWQAAEDEATPRLRESEAALSRIRVRLGRDVVEFGDIPNWQFLSLSFCTDLGKQLDLNLWRRLRTYWEYRAHVYCESVILGGPEAWEKEYEFCRAEKLHLFGYWWRLIDYERHSSRLFLNPIQRLYWGKRTGEDGINVVCKARKQGLSTIIDSDYTHDVLFLPYTRAVIVTHKLGATSELKRRVNYAVHRLPPFLRPEVKAANTRVLSFLRSPFGGELDSMLYIDSARAFDPGRATDIDRAHFSEYAYYPDPIPIYTGILDAFREGACGTIETTPNGDDDFAVKFRLGDPEFKSVVPAEMDVGVYRSHFFRWFDDPRYRKRPDGALELTREEAALKSAYNLDDSQINWRRIRIARYTNEGGKYTFLKEYPEDKRTCFILSAGGHIFDLEKLADLRLLIMSMETPEVRPVEGGTVTYWVKPIPGRRYVGGADSSEGETGSNASGCGLLDIDTGEQVAVLHGLFTPKQLAERSAALCTEYNEALLAVERNNPGVAVLQELMHHIMYPNLYWHISFAANRRGVAPPRVGWVTEGGSKMEMIGSLVEGVNEEHMVINDLGFVDECMTFVRDGLKVHAQRGCSDDRVLYWGIAHRVLCLIRLGYVHHSQAPQIFRISGVSA